MEYGAIFIIIALAAFMGSYLGNKLSSPKAAAVCSNDVALPPPPPPKSATYEFEYKTFMLKVKVEDGCTLDDFDQEAIQSRFEARAESEEQSNNRGWKIYIAVKRLSNTNFYSYYQATSDDINYSKDAKDRRTVWFAINDALIYAFENISKNHGDDNDDGNDEEFDPNDPLGSAIDKLFAE